MKRIPQVLLLLYCGIVVLAGINLLNQIDWSDWWQPAMTVSEAETAFTTENIETSLTLTQLQEAYLQQLLVLNRQELAAELRAFDLGLGCEERVQALITEVRQLIVALDELTVSTP